jgi:glyoxylase-like metal-dependent hydrolase (beta-lactamase superfamily II)
MQHSTLVKTFSEITTDGFDLKARWPDWDMRLVLNDDNCTYLMWNKKTQEAAWIDPMKEDWETLAAESRKLLEQGYRFIAVVDSHTHADHISSASDLAKFTESPLIQHESGPSRRIDIRISRDTALSTAAGPFRLLCTPGHTPDSLTLIWGPFILGADTLLYADTGRDDLPGGDPAAHYESMQKIKSHAAPDMVLLPGHDGAGGRASSWATQLKESASLTQDRETFVREAGSYVGPAPRILKESLFENFK